MNDFEPILDDDKRSHQEAQATRNNFSWLSILVSLFFIGRGIMEIGNGRSTWGGIMLMLGIGGLIYKVWENSNNK